MAGPYTRRDDDDHDHDELELDAVYALHHLDSQQHDDDNELDTQPDDERAPFYSHLNSSYGHARGNGSEASLPLYRSRSQSLSAAAANNEQHHNNSSNKLPAMPGQPPAASTPAPNVRAVDYSQTDSADNLRRAQPPSSRQSSSRANTLQSSTTTSSNSNHNDTSQSTTWSSNANTLTNSQTPSSQTPVPQHHDKKRIDWAAEVARVFDPATGTTKSFADEKIEHANHNGGNNQGSAISRTSSPLAPGMARRWTETDLDDENGFDDYDWEDDDELVRQLDKKYEDEYKKANDPEDKRRRRTVIRRFSPVHLLNLLLFTFLGNLVFIFLLIAPALIVQFLVKGKTQDEHLQFVCDNIEAWCYWIAFNFIAKWIIHSLFDLIPKLFVFVVELIWGDLNERFIGYVELFNASAPYIKPLFFAGFFWGSFAITFNSIFDLRNASDPENSRAPYTYRIYQVVECLFFIALIWSIEKILIRYISLNFHAVAYADRLKNNTFALTTIDKLKSYRPKRSKRNGAGHSGFNTPSAFRVGFGGVSTAGDGYFSSTMGRSRGNTPPFSSPRQMASPDAPGTPEPSHQSLWSRLPIPSTFRGSSYNSHRQNIPSIDNAIPLQVTAQHFTGENRRNIAGHPTSGTSNSQQGEHQHNLSSSQPESASTSIPTTPANNISTDAQNRQIQQGKKNKKQKAKHLFGKKAATAQEIARQAMVDPLKTLNNPDIVGKGLGLEFGGAKDAKKLARDLFYAFRSDSTRNYLITSDFYPAFKTESEAEAAFAVFDKDGNGDISRPEIRATILAAYKERKFLARSLQDVSEAVSTLDKLFQVGALIILALIALAIFQVNIYSNLTTAYTIAIAASFIFKSAAQNVFDSVIFLFATHPFDSGDRIFLETEVYVVKQLGLFSTLFTKWDGTETMIANSKLGTLTITNLRRSPPQFENATLQVGWNTSLDQLDELEKKMNNWLQKDEKRMFAPSTAVVLQKFVYMQYIEITIGMLHRENWQDWGERWNRRTAFHAALLHYCKEIGITFVNSLQPVQYYQDDLDQPPVEDDNDDLDDMRSPLSPSDGENQIPAPASHQQPLMGFLPPEGSTMRRRKGYSKSKNMAGVGA